VESLTHEIAEKAWALIEEIENYGGMTKALNDGLPKRKIEENATQRQARVDSGQDTIVGVNRFRTDDESPIDVLTVDNTKVRDQQIERLHQIRRSTVGEISDVLEGVFGRHQAESKIVTGVYAGCSRDNPEFTNITQRVKEYTDNRSRAPHLLMAKMGQDGHDRGANVIASSFGDIGFKVDSSALFQTPMEIADLCAENKNIDVVGVSSMTAAHLTLIPQLIKHLKERNRADVKVICGGVIPEQDYEALREAGVAGIFGPGTSVIEAANAVLGTLLNERRNR